MLRSRALVAIPLVVALLAALLPPRQASAQQHGSPALFVRYEHQGRIAYGTLQGERIQEIEGDLFGQHRATDRWVPLADVRLLPPTEAKKVIAVGLNFQSHLGSRAPAEC